MVEGQTQVYAKNDLDGEIIHQFNPQVSQYNHLDCIK
jgi:hypothetical protein